MKDQGELAGAAPLLDEALKTRRETLGDKHPNTLTSINNYGLLLKDQGKLAGAAPLLDEALKTRRETLGDKHPDTLKAISNYGTLLYEQGDLAGAAPLFREAFVAAQNSLGAAHPNTLLSQRTSNMSNRCSQLRRHHHVAREASTQLRCSSVASVWGLRVSPVGRTLMARTAPCSSGRQMLDAGA